MTKAKLKAKATPFDRVVLVAIGIEGYQNLPTRDKIRKVAFAKADAEAVTQTFRTIFHGVCRVEEALLVNDQASLTTLRGSLETKLAGLKATDLFVFYYAGHGFQKAQDNRLTAWDTDLDRLGDTSLNLVEEVLKPLRASACRRGLVFIDACAEDMTDARSRSLLGNLSSEAIADYLDDGDYTAVYLACSPGQRSWHHPNLSHGVFTHHLIEALEGRAPDALEDGGWLTDVKLRDWLANSVQNWVSVNMGGKTQTPQTIITAPHTFRIRQIPETVVPKVRLADLNLDNSDAWLEGFETGAIRPLLKGRQSIPKFFNDTCALFVAGLLETDLREELDAAGMAAGTALSLPRDQTRHEWDGAGGGITQFSIMRSSANRSVMTSNDIGCAGACISRTGGKVTSTPLGRSSRRSISRPWSWSSTGESRDTRTSPNGFRH